MAAPLGPPPVLLPAAIFSQVVFDPMEITPEWAKPRPAPAPAPAGPPSPDATLDESAARPGGSDGPDPAPDAAPQTADAVKPKKRARRPNANGTPARRRPKSSG
jgi:hypothetical protein